MSKKTRVGIISANWGVAAPQCAGLPSTSPGNDHTGDAGELRNESSSLMRTGSTMGGSSMKSHAQRLSGVLLGVVLVSVTVGSAAAAQQTEKKVPETFSATTTNMDPTGEDLKFNVLNWSSDADRAAAIKAMVGAVAPKDESHEKAESNADGALRDLPTAGYVWLGSSSIGYGLKYTHRASTPDGGERITFVTDPHLGKYDRTPWVVVGAPAPSDLPFTVIELRLDGSGAGEGKMSVATGISFDETSGTVALDDYDAAPLLLDDVTRQSPLYWARGE